MKVGGCSVLLLLLLLLLGDMHDHDDTWYVLEETSVNSD
jgi:hypothetical protein